MELMSKQVSTRGMRTDRLPAEELSELLQEAAMHIWSMEFADWNRANTMQGWDTWWNDSESQKLYDKLCLESINVDIKGD